MKKVNKQINVKCPHCKTEFNYYDSSSRPFCSKRCKLIDLGQWLSEDYTVAGRDNSVYIEDGEQLKKLLEETDENY